MPRSFPGDKYVVCNSDEGEPGTFKDRDLLRFDPHSSYRRHDHCRLCHGCQAVVTTTSTARFSRSTSALKRRSMRRVPPDYLGNNILGSDFSFDLFAHHGWGAYICGEETGLLESIEGKKGQPRYKPPFPATSACMANRQRSITPKPLPRFPSSSAWAVRLTSTWASPTTAAPSCFRFRVTSIVPATTRFRWARPFAKLLEMAGGMRGGRKLKAVIPGGSSAPGAAGRRHDEYHHGLRLHCQSRLDARFRRGDRDG
jgi:NADH-quinone oxidoreductase subunit F